MEPKEGRVPFSMKVNSHPRGSDVCDEVDSRRQGRGQEDKKGHFSTEHGLGKAASRFPAFPSESSVRTTLGG